MRDNQFFLFARKIGLRKAKTGSSTLGCGQGKGQTDGWVGRLLLRWVMREANAFCDVALQAFYTGLEECLFVLVEIGEWVLGFLCSGCLFSLAGG